MAREQITSAAWAGLGAAQSEVTLTGLSKKVAIQSSAITGRYRKPRYLDGFPIRTSVVATIYSAAVAAWVNVTPAEASITTAAATLQSGPVTEVTLTGLSKKAGLVTLPLGRYRKKRVLLLRGFEANAYPPVRYIVVQNPFVRVYFQGILNQPVMV